MFEGSLLESTPLLQSRNRWPMFLSVAIQASLAAALITIPLLHPEALSRLALNPPILIAPPTFTPPPPPPPLPAHAAATSAPAESAPPLLVTHTEHSIADRILKADPTREAPPGVIPGNMPNSSPFGTGTSITATTASPTVVVAVPSKPTRVSEGVTAGMLLAPIQPVYPHIGIVTRTQGTVIIHAIISKVGIIESASVISGPPLLQGAAIDAVKAARYRPFQLNGAPTEVDTTITVNFRLNN